MEQNKSLNKYQKGILLIMIVMSMIFAVLYCITTSRVGFEYKDTILCPSYENGTVVYSGKLKGQQAQFTVTEDKEVIFYYGDKKYGPYTAREDSTAIPKDTDMSNHLIGVEIKQNDEIIFRGGVFKTESFYLLYNEDGTTDIIGISYVKSDGVERDVNGNEIDSVEPSVTTILKLIDEPELTHKGYGPAWFYGAFVCIINAIYMLYADELFYWNLSFQIRNSSSVEPSDWEIAGRYISWVVLTIIALAIYVIGLLY